MLKRVPKDATYVLNHCARSLARDNSDPRHDFGQFKAGDFRSTIAEAWRFPIIDSYRDPSLPDSHQCNCVTFICVNRAGALGNEIGVIGSFHNLFEPIPLQQIDNSDYWAVSLTVPKQQSHVYKFIAGGRAMPDPINPLWTSRRDGSIWSRFFTDYCTDMLVLEAWEASLLERLTNHILPFRTTEAQRFIDYYYKYLDKSTRDAQIAHVYRLDQPVGVVNFIDKLLARQEQHRLIDYHICLELCDTLLRRRSPGVEPNELPLSAYQTLYEQLSHDDGRSWGDWDYARYRSPRFFLQLLRRHTFMGAFAHPKHGGNSGAAGWQFLSSNLTDPQTGALPMHHSTKPAPLYFDWARAMEKPLGTNSEYLG